MEEMYVKGNEALLVSKRFTYEVFVNCYFENYFSTVSTTMFESDTFIENLVESYFVTKHTEIYCELFSAPLSYIKENGYKLWEKKTKKPKKKKK